MPPLLPPDKPQKTSTSGKRKHDVKVNNHHLVVKVKGLQLVGSEAFNKNFFVGDPLLH